MIARLPEGENSSFLKSDARAVNLLMKRSPQELMVTNYNKPILRALRANMDIQYITNILACVAYLTSYICKLERAMRDMMRKASKETDCEPIRQAFSDIGHIFIKYREVSEHEAVLRILSLPLHNSNIDVQFIQTDIPQKRTRIVKSRQVLEHMLDDETDIFLPSIHDKYTNRPNCMENIC
ncbi:hypothetical protein MAR_032162 [Mya arenaria]|uniref:Uncharacterized protein n=1 Tax=Mya arenaria TaxID=6604 RepID=A0ABY7F5V0_MYAAR|nr:hypothetical protein MAR_032162 [Mya arenaria]